MKNGCNCSQHVSAALEDAWSKFGNVVRQTGQHRLDCSLPCPAATLNCTSHYGQAQIDRLQYICQAICCVHLPSRYARPFIVAGALPACHPATSASSAPLLHRMIRPQDVLLDATCITLDNDLSDQQCMHHQFGVSYHGAKDSLLNLDRYVSYTRHYYPLYHPLLCSLDRWSR